MGTKMTIYNLANCENKVIRKLTKQIHLEQVKCKHEFDNEWQEYSIYKKRCKKCAYVQSVEY